MFWASKPDSGLGGRLSYRLLKSKTSGGKQREELRGLRLETVQTDSLTGHSWELIGPLRAAGSPLAPAHSSLLKLSGNESQPVRASGADGTHWGQLAEKALQRNPETSDRWKEPEADEDVLGGEVGVRWCRKEPRLQAGNKRPLGDYKLERQQIVNLSPS